jgi:carbon monoxide dehydrogenase subunit G
MTEIEFTRHMAAPADEVWEILIDQARWAEWSGFDSVEILRRSQRSAIRVVTSGEVGVRDLIRLGRAGRRFTYRHLDGLPVRHYAGQITLSPDPAGTVVVWRVQLEPLYLGSGAIIDVLNRVIQQAIDALAEIAETQWRKTGFRMPNASYPRS